MIYEMRDFRLTQLENRLLFNYFNNLDFENEVYKFGDRIVKAKRLSYFYGDTNYKYSKQVKKPHKFDEIITKLANMLEEELKLNKGYFNGVLVNKYSDGNVSLGYHKDDEPDMIDDTLIVSLAFGAKRYFYIKNDKTNEVTKVLHKESKLLIMYPDCQKYYKHAILKKSSDEEDNGIRISLTFRRFKE